MERTKASPPTIQKGVARIGNGTDLPAQITSEKKAINDQVKHGHTILAGGNSPAQACVSMSKANDAAYAPAPMIMNVRPMRMRLLERPATFNSMFAAKAMPRMVTT